MSTATAGFPRLVAQQGQDGASASMTSTETPAMANMRLEREARIQRFGATTKPNKVDRMTLDCTLVTHTMDSVQEDMMLQKLETTVSGEARKPSVQPHNAPGFLDGVDRTIKYEPKPGQRQKKKTYKQVKPYFAY